MASSTLSDTPAFLRLTSESVLRSNLLAVPLILAMTTASGSPALTIWITESFVSTSWASEVAPGSDRLTAATRSRTSTARILFMSPPGQRENGRDRPGPSRRSHRSITNLGYFVNPVNSGSNRRPAGEPPRRRKHREERHDPVQGHGRGDPDGGGQGAAPQRNHRPGIHSSPEAVPTACPAC